MCRGRGRGLRAKSGEEPVPEGIHRPDRCAGVWPEPVLPAPVRRPIHDCPVGSDDAHGHVVARPLTGDDARRLVVAEDHEHQLLVVELLHERGQRVECVGDGLGVGGLDQVGVPPHLLR